MMQNKIIFILFLHTSVAFGQNSVSGKVIDLKNSPIPFATATIYPVADTTSIKGTTTDKTGLFRFNDLQNGQYVLQVQLLGFRTVERQIEMRDDKEILEDIILSEDITELKEVEIIAERSILENELGKKVLRIGNDLSNTGTSAIEALERIPSVTITQQGNIQIRGSSNVIIYINGKETTRSATSLRYIPAEVLDKIEVITNPSAKYDAEGVGGIINIVYKKTKRKPLKIEGIVNASAPARVSGGFNASLNKNNLSFYANVSATSSITENAENSTRVNAIGQSFTYKNNIDYKGIALRRNLNTGLTYQPDSTLTADVEINYSRWDDDNDAVQTNIFSYRGNRQTETFFNKIKRKELEDEATLSVSIAKQFRIRKKLQLLIIASGEDENNFSRFADLSAIEIPPEAQQFLKLSDEDEQQRLYQIKLDYESPFFNFGTFETGLKFDYINYDIFQNVIFQDDNMTIPDNIFSIQQSKYAAYVLQKKSFKNFEYALGVRLEHFSSNSIQESEQQIFEQENTNVFPSLQMKYNFDEGRHNLGLNYTRRIDRPGFFDVNPYISFNDPLNLSTGNPELKPELASLFEVNHHLKINDFTSDITGFYRSTEDVIQAIVATLNENQTLRSLSNFGKREDYGIEAVLEYKPNGFFNTYGTFSLTHTKFQDNDIGIAFNNTTVWGFRLNEQFRFKSNWTLDLAQTYQAPGFEPQREILSQFYMDINLSKKFSNGKGSISLNLRDIFDKREFETRLQGKYFTLGQREKFQSQRLILGLQYTILE